MIKLLRLHFILILTILVSCYPVSRYINDDSVLKWEGDIEVFDSLNLLEPSDKTTLLVTGSSSVRLWDSIHSDLDPYRVMQRGYGGANLSDFNHYADRIIKPVRFQAILVFVANDITGGGSDRTPREVLKLCQTLVEQIRERNGDTPVFWIETTPTPSRWQAYPKIRRANDLIQSYCERNENLYFIATRETFLNPMSLPDSSYFRKDMLHLNRKGYKKWSGIIKTSLENAGIAPVS